MEKKDDKPSEELQKSPRKLMAANFSMYFWLLKTNLIKFGI